MYCLNVKSYLNYSYAYNYMCVHFGGPCAYKYATSSFLSTSPSFPAAFSKVGLNDGGAPHALASAHEILPSSLASHWLKM